MDRESRIVTILVMFALGGAVGFYLAPYVLSLAGN